MELSEGTLPENEHPLRLTSVTLEPCLLQKIGKGPFKGRLLCKSKRRRAILAQTSSLGIEFKRFWWKSTTRKLESCPIESGSDVNALFGAINLVTFVMPMLLGKGPVKSLSPRSSMDKDDKPAKV